MNNPIRFLDRDKEKGEYYLFEVFSSHSDRLFRIVGEKEVFAIGCERRDGTFTVFNVTTSELKRVSGITVVSLFDGSVEGLKEKN